MRAEALLTGLLSGEPDAVARVLHNARLEGLGTASFGGEAIGALLRTHAAEATSARVLEAPTFAALVGRGTDGAPVGVAVDLHEGWVTRMWRLGAAAAGEPPEPSVSVPTDLDLDQRGGRVAFDPAMHPELEPAHAEAVRALGQAWLTAPPPEVAGGIVRLRPLVLRAASSGGEAAALFRLEGAAPGGFAGFYALALFGAGEREIVVDVAGRAAAMSARWDPLLRDSAA